MISIIFAFLFLLAAPNAVFKIEAEELELSKDTQSAFFSGQVTATQGDLVLTCDQLRAQYDPQKGLTALELQGHVELRQNELRITAGIARYEAASDCLTLQQDPQITRENDRIAGEQIRFWPQSGRIQIRKARGQFQAPELEKLQKSLPQIMPSSIIP